MITQASIGLKNWRKNRNLTQKQAAEKMEVPFDTYRKWEKGYRKPQPYSRMYIQVKTNNEITRDMWLLTCGTVGD